MPNKGPKGRKNIILIFSILLFSLALMSLSSKKEISFLDTLASLILNPFQNLFSQSIRSVSDGINHYLDLVNTSKENDRLKSKVERLINEKNELIERISRQKRVAALMAYQKDRKKSSLVASVIGRDITISATG